MFHLNLLNPSSAGAAGNFLASINQLSTNAFKSVMDIDVLGSYNTAKATLPHLLTSASKHRSDGTTTSPAGTGGRIVFVSATFHYTAMPLQTHVSVAKAGVDALSNNVAVEFGPRGITSNVIAPGPIAGTEGMERLAKVDEASNSRATVPLGRWGTVKEISDATVYLFSDAGSYVTGHALVGKSFNPPCVNVRLERELIRFPFQSTEDHGGRRRRTWAGSSIRIFF